MSTFTCPHCRYQITGPYIKEAWHLCETKRTRAGRPANIQLNKETTEQ